MSKELRPYQQEGLDALRTTLRQGVKKIVLQLPTGGGKTLVSASIAKGVLQKGKRMAFVVPRIVLVDQVVSEYWQEGIRDEIGVQQGVHQLEDGAAPIQVCSIDTLRTRGRYPEADVVIFDEGHILTKTHKRWMEENPEKIFIALTATPWSTGMGKHFETLLVMETTKGLIDKEWLCPFRVFAPDIPDMRHVKVNNTGKFAEKESSEVMQKLTGNIVDTWVRGWNKDKTLCFAVDLAHAKAIQERFLQAGISCGYQDARTCDADRRKNKKQFHSGELRIVVSVGTLLLGTDWNVHCISDCQPTKSEIRHVQKIGRGLRTAEGKECLMVFDHAGNTSGRYDKNGKLDSLGYVTDIFHESLDMGNDDRKNERKTPLPKKCPQCTMLRPAGTAKCPNCGFEAKPVNSLFENDGELVELIPGMMAKPKKKKQESTFEDKQLWYSMFVCYAQSRGYKPGWAANKYRERFDVWPRGLSDRPIEPSMQCLSYIRSRQIAFAKSRRQSNAATL